MKKKNRYSYNERLFSSGIRKKLHTARFHWLTQAVKNVNCQYTSVVELGCFDGKALDYLPTKPSRYLGLDANWEGGLDLARKRWNTEQDFEFRECHTPREFELHHEQFDIAICMDTLEHIAPNMVEAYLYKLSLATRKYIFISVPNEKGGIFLAKYLLKNLLQGDVQHYTLSEIVNTTLGRMDRVQRKEHKGFDYEVLLNTLAHYFTIHAISGYPFETFPLFLNFGIGITGRILEKPGS